MKEMEEMEEMEEEKEEDDDKTPLWRTYLVPANFADLVAIFQLWLDVVLFYGGEVGVIPPIMEKAQKKLTRKNPWIKFFTRYKVRGK